MYHCGTDKCQNEQAMKPIYDGAIRGKVCMKRRSVLGRETMPTVCWRKK